MPDYVAFLRAINLGATRRFAKDDVRAATEAAGGTDVETYLNTGNVRLTSTKRSASAVAQALAAAYEEAAGFAVPTIVLTPTELAEVAATGRALNDAQAPVRNHYVSLYATAPTEKAARAVRALDLEGEVCVVEGRAAHCLLDGDIHTSKLLRAKEFRELGEGTSRTLTVLETVAAKWR
jgi:uncharacterized protein (DUF1697 family)